MRVLFVSNYFPPHYIGGYELHCAQVAHFLAAAGHPVRVLTSTFRKDDAATETESPGLEVARELELRYWTDVTDLGYWRREWRDVRIFRRHVTTFRPDLVVLWNMNKLASGIVLEAQRLAPCLAYHLMDEWAANFRTANGLPQFWARGARSFWGRVAKPALREIYRRLLTEDVTQWQPRNAALVSKALGELMRKHEVEFERTYVSYITYEPGLFADAPTRVEEAGVVRFLWAGRMCEGKGLKTTLDALDRLWRVRPEGWRVDFCGPMDAEVNDSLFAPRIGNAPWRDRVRYLGSLPHSEMPRQYREHDVFLFTSEVHEGLPGTIIEAFAGGLAVIGTLTGGTNDVLRADENCLVYPMGDAGGLAVAMERLIADAGLRQRLSADVEREAREKFSSDVVFPRLLAFYEGLLRK